MNEISRECAIEWIEKRERCHNTAQADCLSVMCNECSNNYDKSAEKYVLEKSLSDMKKLENYETRLKKSYGECDNLLDVIVDGFVKQAEIHEIGNPIKARLLTDDDVDIWENLKAYKNKLQEIEKLFEPKEFGEYPNYYVGIAKKVEKIIKGE